MELLKKYIRHEKGFARQQRITTWIFLCCLLIQFDLKSQSFLDYQNYQDSMVCDSISKMKLYNYGGSLLTVNGISEFGGGAKDVARDSSIIQGLSRIGLFNGTYYNNGGEFDKSETENIKSFLERVHRYEEPLLVKSIGRYKVSENYTSTLILTQLGEPNSVFYITTLYLIAHKNDKVLSVIKVADHGNAGGVSMQSYTIMTPENNYIHIRDEMSSDAIPFTPTMNRTHFSIDATTAHVKLIE